MRISNRLRRSVIAASIFAALALPVAHEAQAFAPQQVQVSSGDLATALEALAQQYGVNVIYPADQLVGARTNGVEGHFEAREAFERLLQGTSLKVVVEDGSILISLPATHAVPSPSARSGARQNDGSETTLDAVNVRASSSRIDRPGFDAPTPTTTLTAEDLSIGARPNVGAALNDLPSFRAGVSPQTSGTNNMAGSAPADLRGLGANRTLVLIDGRRFSSTNDLNTIPSVLVSGLDVVTGGASAAWGSGAVSGVVNIAMNRSFTGVKLGAQYGVSDAGDSNERRFDAAVGGSILGGRGHLVVGAEFLDNDGIVPRSRRSRASGWANVPTGDGRFVITPGVSVADAAYGGLILGGVLKDKEFNPDGTLSDFKLGERFGNGASMVGGDGPTADHFSPLMTPQKRYNAMAISHFDLTDNTRLVFDLRHSRMYNTYPWFGDHNRGGSRLTIRTDNAFLPTAVRDTLVQAGESSFQMGRFNADFAYPDIDFERKTTQGMVGLEGYLGDQWRWDAYYSHGEYRENVSNQGFRLRNEFNWAVDSVLHPETGQPVCRIALTDPGTNCVPINLFGHGSPSQAAIAYVTGAPSSRTVIKLDTGGASLRGEPWQLPAGDVSVAVGIESRRESQHTTVGVLDAADAFATYKYAPLFGTYSVNEAFGEILVPVVRDRPGFNKLEVNAAARISDYDTTGSIWSWKFGATNEFLPGLRGRFTRSRDIRSANLTEMYTTATVGWTSLADPVTGHTVSPLIIGSGNPNLKPEEADTLTAGFTYTPSFVEGLDISIDYFNITIRDVITSIGVQEVVTRCFRGNQMLCGQIFRGPDNVIERVMSTPVNLAEYKTDGVDAEVLYTFDADKLFAGLGGRLQWRTLATWVNNLTTDDGQVKLGFIGSQGSAFVGPGVPRLRVVNNITYRGDVFSGYLRARHISAGHYNRSINIVNNRIGSYTYFDLGWSARLAKLAGADLEVHATVNNLFDKEPPMNSGYSAFYDVIGRYYSLGARVKF